MHLLLCTIHGHLVLTHLCTTAHCGVNVSRHIADSSLLTLDTLHHQYADSCLHHQGTVLLQQVMHSTQAVHRVPQVGATAVAGQHVQPVPVE